MVSLYFFTRPQPPPHSAHLVLRNASRATAANSISFRVLVVPRVNYTCACPQAQAVLLVPHYEILQLLSQSERRVVIYGTNGFRENRGINRSHRCILGTHWQPLLWREPDARHSCCKAGNREPCKIPLPTSVLACEQALGRLGMRIPQPCGCLHSPGPRAS